MAETLPRHHAHARTVDDGSGRSVTAFDVARAAVDAGVGHLRAAAVLAEIRGEPVDLW